MNRQISGNGEISGIMQASNNREIYVRNVYKAINLLSLISVEKKEKKLQVNMEILLLIEPGAGRHFEG